ncbi:MAG TPA: arginine N-succinyltransferase [Sandaracinaceae bacterium LLY-WYZ-13_1]|nr:arginine N-succinyltransferase [Sandaracinaceae bacterium LLY-WYZ-13_1]
MRYAIRAATTADHDELHRLAEHLDSVNLPHDEAAIAEILELSERSFSGAIHDPKRRQYVFVLRDLEEECAVGTSMVIAQLGNRDAPYIFFDVRKEERYSESLDRHFVHEVLSIGYSYHGPTEIGGLVVHPDYRRVPERLGMLVSYVRFLFIAIHRDLFQNRVLAELMPPLEPDGTSHLWEAVGRRFTGMSYREADRLSKKNKEFIRGLFPNGDIYASLLAPDAQAVIGEVGRETKGVAKMLTRIGFRYWDRVDPFDGGPHFIAPTDEIELVQRTHRARVAAGELDGVRTRGCLVARTHEGPPWFEAVAARARIAPDRPDAILVEAPALAHLGLQEGDITPVLPLY